MSHPLSYRHARTPSVPMVGWIFAWAAVAVGLLGNLLASGLVVASLWDIPRGTPIRPMLLAAWMFFVAAGAAGVAIVLTVLALVMSRRRKMMWLVAVIGLLISPTPLPVSWKILDWIVARHGLVLED